MQNHVFYLKALYFVVSRFVFINWFRYKAFFIFFKDGLK